MSPWHFLRVLAVAALVVTTARAQTPTKIDVAKMRPKGLLVDRYSYMAPPYNTYYFHHIDELGFRTDPVARSGTVYPLREPTEGFTASYTMDGVTRTLDQYFGRNGVVGFLVLHDDQIVLERYFHGADRQSRFVSQSVGKSIVSILMGAAVDEGLIRSVDDPIATYLPDLASTGYRDVTVKHVLQMATGVGYNENYQDSTSGAASIGAALVSGKPTFKEFVRSMKATPVRPGTKFDYQSVNTQVLGLLIERVTGKRLNQYAALKLWSKIGAERDAFFYEARSQPDICAFACFNATVRDYGRVGLLMMRRGTLGGTRVVSERWARESTRPGADFEKPTPAGGLGYGYQWWIPFGADEAFLALGIYGQSIYVNPARHVVIVQTSAWPEPVVPALGQESHVVQQTIAERFPRR